MFQSRPEIIPGPIIQESAHIQDISNGDFCFQERFQGPQMTEGHRHLRATIHKARLVYKYFNTILMS